MQQKTLGDIVIGEHPSQHYKTLFSQKTGFFVRLEEDGQKEPFWSEDGPELLDLSITNYCERCCDFCYRQANPLGRHMPMNDVENVVEQAKEAGVLQIALGGGNPNQHPNFIEILRIIRENNIVPLYTSNGEKLTDKILKATKQYCGAMALSLYPPYERYGEIAQRIADYGIKLNLHVILKYDTIDILSTWFKEPPAWFTHIRDKRLLDIWQTHPSFVKHRDAIRNNSCIGCKHQAICNGGCVFMPEINQCEQR